MSRTPRCAPFVEAELLSLVVVPAPCCGMLATMTLAPPSGPEHRLPILVTGEGETVARAVGAAEAAAAKALRPKVERPKSAQDRRQLELVGSEA
jgi:hypothetical protein